MYKNGENMIYNPIARPYITVTNIIWSFDSETQQIKVLLIKREESPFRSFWALPETLLRDEETAHMAALRLVRERIGVSLTGIHAEQLATFTAPERNPDFRALSLSYMIFLPENVPLTPGPGASDAAWFTLNQTSDNYFHVKNGELKFKTLSDNEYLQDENPKIRLAFDHNWILTVACHRVVNKLDYQPTILLILGSSFTLKLARHIFCIFGQYEPDNSNFLQNHKIILEPIGLVESRRPGRPAKKYRLTLK